MNKPVQPPAPDPAIGPLDEQGQQLWSADEEVASARLDTDVAHRAALDAASAAVDAGEWFTSGQVRSHMDEVKRRWAGERARR